MQRHQLCRRLHAARADAGLNQRQVAEKMDWSPSKVARVETGRVGLSLTDLAALLDLYGVADTATREEYKRMARAGRNQPWNAFADVLPPDQVVYLGCEASATRLRRYDPLLVPALLRTEPYARLLIDTFARPETPAHVRQRRLAACLARQAIFDQPQPPRLCFVLDEAAVRRLASTDPMGSHIVRGQRQRLHELADRPAVSIQIMPLSHGVHPGLTGSFVVLDLPTDDNSTAVYRDTGTGRSTRAADHEVAHYHHVFGHLSAAASAPDRVHEALDSITAPVNDR